jgi:hypothetical protein
MLHHRASNIYSLPGRDEVFGAALAGTRQSAKFYWKFCARRSGSSSRHLPDDDTRAESQEIVPNYCDTMSGFGHCIFRLNASFETVFVLLKI